MNLLTFAATFVAISVFQPIVFARSVQVIDKQENVLVYHIREALQDLNSRLSKLEQAGKNSWKNIQDSRDKDPSSTVQFQQGSNGIQVIVPVQEYYDLFRHLSFQFKTAVGEGVLFHVNQWNISKVYIQGGKLHFYDGKSSFDINKFVADDEWHTVHILLDEPQQFIQINVDESSTRLPKVTFPVPPDGPVQAIMFGGDLVNSSNIFIGCMRHAWIGSASIELNKYYNAVPGCPIIKPAAEAAATAATDSVNLKTDDLITFEFLNNYVPQRYLSTTYLEPQSRADFMMIEFVTNQRNNLLLGLKGKDKEYFNVVLDNRGFLKFEFFMFSRFHELVIGNESLTDGNLHKVHFILTHYGPSITFKVYNAVRLEEKLFAPTQLNENKEFSWSTLSLGRNGTGFTGCITTLLYNEENLLTFLWNTSIKSNTFKSVRTVPKDLKREACSNYKYVFGTGLGDADLSTFLKRREDHKHHTHDSCHHGIGDLAGTNYSRHFLETLHKDLQSYLQREDKVDPLSKVKPTEQVKPEHQKSDDDNELRSDAFCDVRPNTAIPLNNRLNIRGRVAIKYQSPRVALFDPHSRRGSYAPETITLRVEIRGLFPPQSAAPLGANYTVGMHIHEFGNLTNGCNSTGGHFNPYKKSHGSPHFGESHFGDFGNIVANAEGVVNTTLVIQRHRRSLFDASYIYIGKALVIHEKEDDLGLNESSKESKVNGNAGSRVACCIIYPINDTLHDLHHHDHAHHHLHH